MTPPDATHNSPDRRDVLKGALAAVPVAALAMLIADTSRAAAQPASGGTADARILTERIDDNILLVGLDGGAENRVTVAMFEALGRAYHELESDPSLRVAVLWGKGPDFCGGLHLQDWATRLSSGPLAMGGNFINPVATVGTLRAKPVVVAVQGLTAMLGHELLLAADIRVAASDSRFHQGEAARALYPGGGATIRFVQEAGWGAAMRYMLTGDEWTADDALALGLVQEIAPAGQQLDRAVAFARKIAACAPLGIQSILRSQQILRQRGEQAAYEALLPQFGSLFRTEDFRERLQAVRENRKPVYHGR